MKIVIAKMRESAKTPFKKHLHDAGYDLSWAPSDPTLLTAILELDGKKFINCTTILPNQSKRFETGLKVNFPHDYVLEIKNRSGMASKKDLLVGACVVDSTYTGEVFVDLHNVSGRVQVVEAGERIAQFLVYKIENCLFEEIPEEQYNEELEVVSERKTGGFGSTGHI